jgi:hypothetical protein
MPPLLVLILYVRISEWLKEPVCKTGGHRPSQVRILLRTLALSAFLNGHIPKRSNGAVCKTVGLRTFAGSNPAVPIQLIVD